MRVNGSQTVKRKNEIKKWLFYTAIISLPLLQFIIMYVIVNINTFLMAFRTYNNVTKEWSWAGLANFEDLFREMSRMDYFKYAFKNSIIGWLVNSFVGITLGVIFAYYIYKRSAGWQVFRIALFLPSVLSATVLITIFRYFADIYIPGIAKEAFDVSIKGLLMEPETKFTTIMIFNIFISFGTSVLMYTGAMTSISTAVFEAGKIDGVRSLEEFWYIVVPQIIPTVSIFILTSIAQMFVNQFHIYSFDWSAANPKIYTVGYYLYMKTQTAKGYTDYIQPATLGLVLTCIIAPFVLFIRWLLKKVDPMED